jgi:D-alanyl-lipoteichoic acid acyltransferase DltB (MBOAT superfamily)
VHLDSRSFLAVVLFFLVYAAASPGVRRWLLVAGSVGFYATLQLRFVPLFVASGLLTFWVGGRLHRAPTSSGRDRWLWAGVGANVATLVSFKLAGAFHDAGAVPLGISFYTLQAISYLVDVHRHVCEPPASGLSFLASFTLFPHLLSGPIVRASQLVPQIEGGAEPTWPAARRALLLFTVGLAKKTVADRLGPLSDAAFDGSGSLSFVQAWTGLLAYAAQLYADFSGYTDMATGLAALLGLELPPNFDLPYLATSPADFWRRWHISLSTWLRDYLYLPLGVRLRRHRSLALVITWVFAGLWHGVGTLYLLYGLYHGVLLAITDVLARRWGGNGEVRGVIRIARTVLTFYLVLIGYVLFRSRSVGSALHYLTVLHVPRALSATAATTSTLVLSATAVVFGHLLDHALRRRQGVAERPWLLWPAMVFAVTAIVLFGSATRPFIYFAF